MIQLTPYRIVSLAIAFILTAALFASDADDIAWKQARPDYAWSFPQDHWARHGYKTEWWYFTGHLQAADGRRFGYQFTFFRVGIRPTTPPGSSQWAARDLIMGHAALSDLDSQEHRFSEVLYRAIPLLGGFGAYPESLIAWSRGPAGTDSQWQLRWNGSAFDFEMTDTAQGFSLSLSTHPLKPLVFQGPRGLSRKGEKITAASQYYSFTRLRTSGQVTLDGKTLAVTGQSWMDKEFGSNQLDAHQVGWDWFSLQLNDQRDIMLFLLRDKNGAIDFASATLVQPDGQTQHLGPEAFTVTPRQKWKSPKTLGNYPSRWLIRLPQENLQLELVAKMADQENRSRLVPKMYYWEGAVDIRRQGQSVGQGYVELTGYGDARRPAI
jgi:predicted secreted hydrolase